MKPQNGHILTMTSAYPVTPDGNHATFLRETMIRLQSAGTEFTVFAPAYEGSKGYVMDNIRVHRFRYCFKQYENLARDGAPTKLQRQPLYLFAAATYILLGSIQLFWVCLRNRPDALHVHWPFPHGLMAYPTSRLLKIPMVFSFHGAELLLMRKFGFVKPILKWLCRDAIAITANSSFTKKLIQDNVHSGDVAVIPYGLTIEAKPPTLRASEATPKLLFVGRLDERKGLKFLLEALPKILEKQPVKLRIVGKGHLETEIKAQCAAMGLEHCVDFLGFVSKEDLANEYASCDIFVLPAIVDSKGDTEGLGIVMIEAMAHEKPVVASRVGGISDVIKNGETGMLIPERNPDALANAVQEMLDRPEWAKGLGKAGLVDAKTRFSWKKITCQWQSVFSKALHQTSPSTASLSNTTPRLES